MAIRLIEEVETYFFKEMETFEKEVEKTMKQVITENALDTGHLRESVTKTGVTEKGNKLEFEVYVDSEQVKEKPNGNGYPYDRVVENGSIYQAPKNISLKTAERWKESR